MGNYFYNGRDEGAYQSNVRTSVDVRVVRETSTTEPVTSAEAKNYLRLDWSDADNPNELALLNTIITTARKRVERYLNSDIVPKERQLYYAVLERDINLMYAPLDPNVTVTVTAEGESTTDFELLGLDNPIFRLNSLGREVQINYTTQGRIENEIKQAVLCCIAELYYGRDAKMMTNWKLFAAPFKVYAYYGVR